MLVGNVSPHSLTRAGLELWVCGVKNLLLCPTVCSGTSPFSAPIVETRVPSSGETWLAKLIEILIVGAAQGKAGVVYGSCKELVMEKITS